MKYFEPKGTTAFTAQNLLERACQQVNFTDFGEESFRTALNVLVESFKKDEEVNLIRQRQFIDTLLGILSKRLEIQKFLTASPQVLETEVKNPLFVVGLPRTGTTLLHNLLAQDPQSRPLLYWELWNPVPLTHVQNRDMDPRISDVEKKLKQMYSANPNLLKVHEMKAQTPGECKMLMILTLQSASFYPEFRLVSYMEWLFQQDLSSAYHYYRQLLQLFLWQKPAEFPVLKCPYHLPFIDAIFKVFPDAHVIWTHRSIYEAIPSVLSLGKKFYPDIQRYMDEIVSVTLKFSEKSVSRAAEARKHINTKQIFDAGYAEMVQDPLKLVEKIYTQFGYDLNPAMVQNMKSWLEANPQNKYGAHKYNLGEFGLTEARLKESFNHYYQEYGDFLSSN